MAQTELGKAIEEALSKHFTTQVSFQGTVLDIEAAVNRALGREGNEAARAARREHAIERIETEAVIDRNGEIYDTKLLKAILQECQG